MTDPGCPDLLLEAMKKRILLVPAAIIVLMAAAFLVYTGSCAHADAHAVAALKSDQDVEVTQTDYGWFFDGPSDEKALVFYPGAKVEETAYAPLLHLLAARGMDVCLARMPFHLAFFDINRASVIMSQYRYPAWYVGGHSLGGAMAAEYAAGHADGLSGVILCAAYAPKPLDDRLLTLCIYGSEDGVLNMEKVAEAREPSSPGYVEHIIDGGNHAQFGCYGLQKRDGTAKIGFKEQQAEAVDVIISECDRKEDASPR